MTTTAPVHLSPQQLDQYQRDGYLVVEDLLSPDEVAGLQARLREYTHGNRPRNALVFQVEPRVERGEMKVDHPGDGIRKIDFLVQNDDLYRKLGTHPNVIGPISQILGPDLKLFRNSLLLKPPSVGSPKGMHQDSPYWPIEPMALCSCWFAIDDATTENGCMGVLPGWHKKGPLPHKTVTDDFVIDEQCYDMKDLLLAPVRAGGGLFFHSLIPHYTAPNRSTKWRRAIALSYMSAKSRYVSPKVAQDKLPEYFQKADEGTKAARGAAEKQGDPGPEYFHIMGRSYPGCVR